MLHFQLWELVYLQATSSTLISPVLVAEIKRLLRCVHVLTLMVLTSFHLILKLQVALTLVTERATCVDIGNLDCVLELSTAIV